MNENKLNDIIQTSLDSIKSMVDSNTVIGTPITTANGTLVIPVSKVFVGFASGGIDYRDKNAGEKSIPNNFGGGGGTGLSFSPVGFLVVTADQIKMVPVSSGNTPIDKLVDYIPVAIEKVNGMIKKNKEDAE